AAPIGGQEHETEVVAARQLWRRRVGQTGGAELVTKEALHHERDAEGEEQTVQAIEMVAPLGHRALDHHTEEPDHDGRDQQRRPVTQAGPLQREVRDERAHHVLRAVSEVDDVQQAEDDRQAQAQHGVEGAVDQPDEELTEQRLRWDAEDRHCASISSPAGSCPDPSDGTPAPPGWWRAACSSPTGPWTRTAF